MSSIRLMSSTQGLFLMQVFCNRLLHLPTKEIHPKFTSLIPRPPRVFNVMQEYVEKTWEGLGMKLQVH